MNPNDCRVLIYALLGIFKKAMPVTNPNLGRGAWTWDLTDVENSGMKKCLLKRRSEILKIIWLVCVRGRASWL